MAGFSVAVRGYDATFPVDAWDHALMLHLDADDCDPVAVTAAQWVDRAQGAIWPAFNSSGAPIVTTFGFHQALRWDAAAASYFYSTADIAGLSAADEKTLVAVCKADATTDLNQCILTQPASGRGFDMIGTVAALPRWQDTLPHHSLLYTTDTSWHVHSYVVPSVGNGRMEQDEGASIYTNAAGLPMDLSAPIRVGAGFDHSYLAKLLLWRRKLLTYELRYVQAALLQHYTFGVVLPAPSFTVGTVAMALWNEDATATKAARMTNTANRQHFFYKVTSPGWVQLAATVDCEIGPLPDTPTRVFDAWCVEFPFASGSPMQRSFATESAVQEFNFLCEGHYTVVMRDRGDALGAVVLHIDVGI